jgi:hypothetical protein
MNSRSIVRAWMCVAFLPIFAATYALATESKPSRPPVDKCSWERLADKGVGLSAWVQRCDFGFRQIHFEFVKGALAVIYSDGGDPDPLVEVFDIQPSDTADAALNRIFAERTDKAIAAQCKVAPYTGQQPLPAGVTRYTFIPDAVYQKALDAKADPNEVGEPPCGDWGDAPDGIQYFEAQPASGAHKVLFVRVGQDEPLFDEKTLRLLLPR